MKKLKELKNYPMPDVMDLPYGIVCNKKIIALFEFDSDRNYAIMSLESVSTHKFSKVVYEDEQYLEEK